jgi:hypothetical protein
MGTGKTAQVWIHGLHLQGEEAIPATVSNFSHTEDISHGSEGVGPSSFVSFIGSNTLTVPRGNIVCYSVSEITSDTTEGKDEDNG